MHREQNVWLHEVITGLSKKSLQTWQRSADSRGVRSDSGVSSQSVESGRSNEGSIGSGLKRFRPWSE